MRRRLLGLRPDALAQQPLKRVIGALHHQMMLVRKRRSLATVVLAFLAACAAQSLFALKAARPAVEPHPREKVLAFAGATCALNAGLALLLKVYLY